MKKNIYNVLLLIFSSVGGFFLGWKMAKKKYENLADEEVASVKARFENRVLKESSEPLPADRSSNQSRGGVKGYSRQPSGEKEKYINYSGEYRSPDDKPKKYVAPDSVDGEGVRVKIEVPCRLTDEEFAESEIESETLYYFHDRVLTDSDYNIIQDVPRIVGDALINLTDEAIVYVRNFEYGKDYEIVIDERSYYDASHRQRPVEDSDDDETD